MPDFLIGTPLGAIIVGIAWVLREWRLKRGSEAVGFERFADLMLQRERELIERVDRLEIEVVELRLLLARNGIDPSSHE